MTPFAPTLTLAAWPRYTAPALLLSSAAILGGAFAFEYVGGLAPCILCLWQRWPHGCVIVLAALAFWVGQRSPKAEGGFLLASGLVLWVGAAIAGYHVGVEQGWWPGPSACGGGGLDPAASAADLRAQLFATPIVRCDEVPWALFGVSMAGYNLLASIGLGAMALYGGARRFIMPA